MCLGVKFILRRESPGINFEVPFGRPRETDAFFAAAGFQIRDVRHLPGDAFDRLSRFPTRAA